MLTCKYKKNNLSFIKEFFYVCNMMSRSKFYVSKNINEIILNYKSEYLVYEDNFENELIKLCLENNDYLMMQQFNLTYTGPSKSFFFFLT